MTTEPSDSRETLKAVDLGFEVQAFLESNIGRYLIGRAEAKIEEAVEGLKHVSPDNAAQIRALQHNIHVAEDFQYWLGEAIQAGLNAQREFIEERS